MENYIKDIVSLTESPSKESIKFTRSILKQHHKYLANLHTLKSRKKSGELELDNAINQAKKLVSDFINFYINIEY